MDVDGADVTAETSSGSDTDARQDGGDAPDVVSKADGDGGSQDVPVGVPDSHDSMDGAGRPDALGVDRLQDGRLEDGRDRPDGADAEDSGDMVFGGDAHDRDTAVVDAPRPDAVPDSAPADAADATVAGTDALPSTDAARQDTARPDVGQPCVTDSECEDDDPCNGDERCDPATGTCAAGAALVCETDRCRGLERCEPFVGCVPVAGQEGAPLCDDGDPCNGVESCDPTLAAAGVPAACGPGQAIVCDDGRFCNGQEACDPTTGACLPGLAPSCDPGNPSDPCDGEWGCDEEALCHQTVAPLVCDDGDPCNGREDCFSWAGCRTVAPAPICDDWDPCNGVETCVAAAGGCQPGEPMVCLDDNPCTDDGCDRMAGGCFYIPNAAPCEDGDPCTLDDVCRDGACAPGHATCLCPADDAFEEDDGAALATVVELPRDRDALLRFPDHVGCGADEDWFVVALTAGDRVSVAVDHDPAYGALELRLEDAIGQVLARASGDEAAAGLPHESAADAPLFLVVAGAAEAGFENSYALDVYHVPAGYCLDDAAEDNDHFTQPAPLGWGPSGHPVAPFSGRLCPYDDEDWFRTTVPADQTLIVDLAFAPPSAGVDFVLRTEAGYVLATGTGAWGLRRASYAYWNGAQDALLRLRAATGADVSYTLTLRAVTDPGCVDDVLEDNDSRATARAVPQPLTLAGVACPGDADWFRLDLTPDRVARGVLASDPEEGPLVCELWTATGLLRACDAVANGWTLLEADRDGPLFVRIAGSGTTAVPYTLWLRADPASGCLDDAFEAAAGPDGAVPFPLATELIGPGTGVLTGVSCAGDDDVYSVVFDAGDQHRLMIVDLRSGSPEEDIELRLLDPAGREVRCARGSNPQWEQIVHSAGGSGAYRLVVPGVTSGQVPYSLDVQVIGGTAWTCGVDPFEPNGSRTDPPPPLIADGMVLSGQVCPFESDWYALDLQPGHHLVLDLRTFEAAGGDVDLLLYDSAGRTVAASRTPTDDERITYTSSGGGVYSARIVGNADGGSYALYVRVLADLPGCGDDPAEDDDTAATATALDVSGGAATAEGVLCPYDEDWYAVDLAEGEALTAELTFLGEADPTVDMLCAAPDGETRALAREMDAGRRLVCKAWSAGRQALRVFRAPAAAGVPIPYRLDVGGHAECPDEYAPGTVLSLPVSIRDTRCTRHTSDSSGPYLLALSVGDTLRVRVSSTRPPGLVSTPRLWCGLTYCVDYPGREWVERDGGEYFEWSINRVPAEPYEFYSGWGTGSSSDIEYDMTLEILPPPAAAADP